MNYRYSLTYNSVTTVLAENEEPGGMTTFQSKFQRGFQGDGQTEFLKTHGVFFEFSNGDVRLDFPGTGRDILKNARDIDGLKAVVRLDIESRESEFDAYVTEFSGNAIIENLEINNLYASVDFEELSVLKNIKDRYDVKVDLAATEDLNGESISSLATETITFPRIDFVSRLINSGTLAVVDTGGGVTFDNETFNIQLNEVQYNETTGIKENNFTLVGSDDLWMGNRLLLSPMADAYNNTIEFDGNISYSGFGGSGATTYVTIVIKLEKRVNNASTTTVDSQSEVVTGTPATLIYSLSDTNVNTDDTVEYYLDIEFTVNTNPPADITLTMSSWIFELQSSAGGNSTAIDAFNHADAIDQNLKVINKDLNLVSDFLQTDFSGLFEFNGYELRNINKSNLNSLRTRLESLNGMFNLGFNLEYDYTVADYTNFRLEKAEYFYQNVEMLDLGQEYELDSYSEEFVSEMMLNRVSIRYSKYADDEKRTSLESIKEYCSEVEYSLLDYSISGVYDREIGVITSPILIADAKRQRYFAEDNQSDKYDDDLFLLDTVTNIPVDDSNTGSILTSGINDQYDYNLRLNVRFCFFNHGPVLNSVFFGRDLTETYRNDFFKIGNTLKIAYANSYGTIQVGDERKFTTAIDAPQMDDNFETGEVIWGERLFDPIFIRFKTAMTASEYDQIKEYHRTADNAKSYGFITITDPDGEDKCGWLIDLTYNIVDKIGEFTLIKKATDYLP